MDKHEKRQEERADKITWPKAFQLRVLRNIPDVASPALLLFAMAGLALILPRRQTQARVLYPILAFLLIYLVVIPFSPLTKTRYLLPMIPVLCLCATGGLMALRPYGFRMGRTTGAVAATLGILLLLMPNIAATYRLSRELTTDSHRELMNWITRYVPPGGTYAVEQRSHVQELWRDEKADVKVPVIFRNDDIVGKPEVAAAIHANGVGYVILTEDAYKDAAERALKNEAERKIFEQMFSPANRLWISPVGSLRYLHPGLRLDPRGSAAVGGQKTMAFLLRLLPALLLTLCAAHAIELPQEEPLLKITFPLDTNTDVEGPHETIQYVLYKSGIGYSRREVWNESHGVSMGSTRAPENFWLKDDSVEKVVAAARSFPVPKDVPLRNHQMIIEGTAIPKKIVASISDPGAGAVQFNSGFWTVRSARI